MGLCQVQVAELPPEVYWLHPLGLRGAWRNWRQRCSRIRQDACTMPIVLNINATWSDFASFFHIGRLHGGFCTRPCDYCSQTVKQRDWGALFRYRKCWHARKQAPRPAISRIMRLVSRRLFVYLCKVDSSNRPTIWSRRFSDPQDFRSWWLIGGSSTKVGIHI